MFDLSLVQQQFTDLNCCIIIPTYNNDHALQEVIEGVLQYTSHVIVVNDGSTDHTASILEQFPDVQKINIATVSYTHLTLPTNREV